MAGRFNVPYGPPKRKSSFDLDSVLRVSGLLKHASLLHADFEYTIARATKGDFVYIDPPYAVERRRIFAEYHRNTFAVDDLARLGACLHDLHERAAVFLISYADSREARELLRRWKPIRIRTRRHVAGFAGHRKNAFELLASNAKELGYDV